MSSARAGAREINKRKGDSRVAWISWMERRLNGNPACAAATGPSAGTTSMPFPIAWNVRRRANDAAELAKAIRDQEDKVEERRKVLATIVRTKGITYKGSDSFYEEKDESREDAIRRGLDAQDYVDAKKEFEKDQQLLQQMKLKLTGDPVPAKPEPPKVDLASLIEEIPAAGDPYSTFSLNISDASFQIAQAAMAKGEQPDPAGIKVEQFYNAVDYGDPSPAAGEPVACVHRAGRPSGDSGPQPGAHRVENRRRRALRHPAAAAHFVGRSIRVDGPARTAARRWKRRWQVSADCSPTTTRSRDRVFQRTPRLLADGMPGGKAGKLAELVNQSASEGGTNLEAAIQLAEQLASAACSPERRTASCSSPTARPTSATPTRSASRKRSRRTAPAGHRLRHRRHRRGRLNDELLGELARNGNGRYYVVGKGADDGTSPNNSPEPSARRRRTSRCRCASIRSVWPRYKLIGFEKDRLKTEDFRNDAVDAAELAAEEAGVAIYQIEPIPDGKRRDRRGERALPRHRQRRNGRAHVDDPARRRGPRPSTAPRRRCNSRCWPCSPARNSRAARSPRPSISTTRRIPRRGEGAISETPAAQPTCSHGGARL
jgi:hypothetical protein